MKDYYKILNVSQKATQDEIKKAYRKLAKKFHPDSNPNNKKATETFKEIAEANAILSDELKRSDYDRSFTGEYNKNDKTKENSDDYKKHYTRTTNDSEDMTEEKFKNFNNNFEDFFGFDPKSKKHNFGKNSENVKPMKTKDAFEKIFGFKK